jgi:DNA-binding NtrC family response regulator
MATILVIDDEAGILTYLEKMLEREGFKTLTAQNGNGGLKILKDNKVDLIITDIVMPEKEGLATIMDMKKRSPDIKIIAMSGGGSMRQPEGYLQMAKDLGAKYTFKKPFERDAMLSAIHELLKDEETS